MPHTEDKTLILKGLLQLAYGYAVLDVMTSLATTRKGFNSNMTKEHMAIRIKQILDEESGAIKLLTEH